MKKLNNKGYNLMELLAVVAILGILSTIGMIAYNGYLKDSREEAYDALFKSTYRATEAYVLEEEFTSEVTLQELFDKGYLTSLKDPANDQENCTGKVTIQKRNASNTGVNKILEEYEYTVNLDCYNGEGINPRTFNEE